MRNLSLFFWLASTSLGIAADTRIYVSLAGEKKIAVYALAANGELTLASSIATSGEPGALIADPKRRFLFAALRSTGELCAFRIDPKSGALSHINTVPAGEDPAHISTDKAGKFLLTAYYVAGKVTVHRIGADGSLSKEPVDSVKTVEKAHAIVLDPLFERAAVIPHTGPNVIYVLHWQSGKFSKEEFVSNHKHETTKDTGPRHVVFHPTLHPFPRPVDLDIQLAYVANEQGSSVTLYEYRTNGPWPIVRLEPKQTLPTLPADFHGSNACAEIRLHPSNRFLYVSNRGHDSLAGFQVDDKTGRLTSLGQTPTEKTPRSFDISPDGKYLYAAGEASGKLAVYRIDAESGKLERFAAYDVGKTPWWVMAIALPEK